RASGLLAPVRQRSNLCRLSIPPSPGNGGGGGIGRTGPRRGGNRSPARKRENRRELRVRIPRQGGVALPKGMDLLGERHRIEGLGNDPQRPELHVPIDLVTLGL